MENSNLLSYDEFDNTMADIKRAYEYAEKWNNFMYNNISGHPNIFQPDCVNTSIILLERMFCDDNHLITYFCIGTLFGKYCKNRVHTVSELYDLLMENIARRSVGSPQITPEDLGGGA